MRQILGAVVRTKVPNFNRAGHTVPGAPTIGTASAVGSNAISVTFTAPVSNGGSAITTYVATASPGGATASSATSPIEVPVTPAGTTEFTVTVQAKNALGLSAASAPSNAVSITRFDGSASVTLGAAVLAAAGKLDIAGTLASTLAAATVESNVITTPDAPTIGTAVAFDGAAEIGFTLGANDGGSPVTSVTMTSSPGGLTGSGSTSPVAVAGLTNGVSYTFTAKSNNVVGASASSAASNSVTPAATSTVPGTPTIGTLSATGSQTLSIAFTAPTSNGGSAITGYEAITTPGSITASGAGSPISISGATNGQAYTVQVRAINAIGPGPWSAASNAATPVAVPSVTGTPFVTTSASGTATILVGYPADIGGSALTSFRFTAYLAGTATIAATQTNTFAEVNSAAIEFTGLTDGVEYEFTAIAINGQGDSPESLKSNRVTPTAPAVAPGKYDSLYDPAWMPVTNTTVYTPPAMSQPAHATSISAPSYTESNFGTKIFRAASLTDSPNQPGTRMRHEYSRRQPFNCDSTRYLLQNGSGFYFLYDANTFTQTPGGVTTADAKLEAVGSNSLHLKDPRDWRWHPTDPDVLWFFPISGMVCYQYNVATLAAPTPLFDLTTRVQSIFGSTAIRITSHEGETSADGRFWGFGVYSSTSGITGSLGWMTYDRTLDQIIGTMVTTRGGNNCDISNDGNFIVISGPYGTDMNDAMTNSQLTGVRAYTMDFSSFKALHYWGSHADMAVDHEGEQVYVTLNQGKSNRTDLTPNSIFYVRCGGPDGPVQILDAGAASWQWNTHQGGGCAKRPGWFVLSFYYDATKQTASARQWADDSVLLMQLKPSGTIYRLVDHRTKRFEGSAGYRQEPQATISPDGLSVMYSCAWDTTSSTTPALAYVVGLPSWIYGSSGGSSSLSYGNNVVQNGSFVAGMAPWALASGTWTYLTSGTSMEVTAPSSSLYQDVTLVPGKTYRITYDVHNYSATGSGIRARLGGGSSTVEGALHTTNGPKTDTLVAADHGRIVFDSASDFAGAARINNVVVIQID